MYRSIIYSFIVAGLLQFQWLLAQARITHIRPLFSPN
jgi:hypothetical protein